MRSAIITAVAALGLTIMTNAVSAAPVVTSRGVEQNTAIVQVADRCGRGWHANRWCTARGFWDTGLNPTQQWQQFEVASAEIGLA
jgi:hypothetical protein